MPTLHAAMIQNSIIISSAEIAIVGVKLLQSFQTPKASEGPVMFKRMGETLPSTCTPSSTSHHTCAGLTVARAGMYYVLAGTGCCACTGGSTIYVMMAESLKVYADIGGW